jgi:hypothetical protein
MATEMDLVSSIALTAQVSLDLGYSHLVAAPTMKRLRNATMGSNTWAWVMMTFKPVLFRGEKTDK